MEPNPNHFRAKPEENGIREEREPKPKLFGLDIFRWGGGLPSEGAGAKKFCMSLESPGKNFLAG